jgi:hypothetical protein
METLIKKDNDNLIRPAKRHVLRNWLGIAITVVVYLLFLYLYFITLYIGIWAESGTDVDKRSTAASVVHSILFTAVYAMMFWSHTNTVLTEPGFLPLEYSSLDDGVSPPALSMLINEREKIHYDKIVKRKMRTGDLASF